MKNKKWLMYLLLFVLILFIPKRTVNAQANKNITVELKSDYTSCAFKLNFTNPGEYIATLISPSTDNYNKRITTDFAQVDDLNMICNATKCKAGTWTISITDPNAESPDEIGTVKVSVEATKEKESDIVDNIKVGKDISGLKLFFVDNELNVKWTDESCGNVTVQVVNTATNEIIDNQNISNQSYSCKITEGIKTITVSVVPTSSSQIEDAIQKFNLEIISEPKGIVTFEDLDYTNKKYIEATADIEQEYGCEVYVNNKNVLQQGMMEPGTHAFNIPLSSENNSIRFYLVDENKNKYSFSKTLVQDTICPTLSLNKEYDGVQTYDNKITITGKLSDYDKFYINDKNYNNISTDGQFDIECSLHLGDNQIKLKAVDKAGNEITYDAAIIMKEKKSSPIGYVIVLVIVVISLVIVITKVIKKRNQYKDDDLNEDSTSEMEKKTEDELDYIQDDEEYDENEEQEGAREMSLDEYEELQKKELKSNATRFEWIKFSILCLALIIFLNFVVTICIIPTGSMQPTIAAGDIVLTNDLAYLISDPKRGEIVVFKSTEKREKMNKRVIGLPGDTISFKNGYVYVNEQKLDESEYLSEDVETNSLKTFVVPADSYFMLGDNRENSDDGRFWNEPFIKKSAIKGKVFFDIPLAKYTSILVEN